MNIKLTCNIPCENLSKGDIFKVLRYHEQTHVVVQTSTGKIAYIPRTRFTFIYKPKLDDRVSKHT